MTDYLAVLASDWTGKGVPCQFTATVNGQPLAPKDPTAPIFQIPAPPTTVVITATPTNASPNVPVHWDKAVAVTVAAGGQVTAGADVKLGTTMSLGFVGNVTPVVIRLSRLQDVTTHVLGLLGQLPTWRLVHGVRSDVVPADEIKAHTDGYGGQWPPLTWDLAAVPDAHFLDAHFLGAQVTPGKLNFTKGALPGTSVDSVVLRLAGTDVPQLFAVTWPKTPALKPTATSGPTPFFLFIRQSNTGNFYPWEGQFVGGDLGPYPDNCDYADEGLYANLHYAKTPLWDPYEKGVPYQMAMAGAPAVTVMPCNKTEARREYGVLAQTEQTARILEEIQAFMFWRAGVANPPATLGNTAIAAFSSGTYYLYNWLTDPTNLAGPFLSNVVKAVYWLDPVLETAATKRADPTRKDANDFIAATLDWAKTDPDKRIRLYMRREAAAHAKLIGKTGSSPYVLNSAHNKRTAAVITDGDWASVAAKYVGGKTRYRFDWRYSHHVICATMLTHALAQGDF